MANIFRVDLTQSVSDNFYSNFILSKTTAVSSIKPVSISNGGVKIPNVARVPVPQNAKRLRIISSGGYFFGGGQLTEYEIWGVNTSTSVDVSVDNDVYVYSFALDSILIAYD